MRLDILGELDSAHALTATAYSTNTIDLNNVTPKRDLGAGEPLEVVVTVDVAADHDDSDETYVLDFIQSANANLSSEDILVSMTVAYSDLTAGAKIHIPIPQGRITKRYIGMKYVLGGTTPAVTLTAHVIPRSFAEQNQAYAKNFTVS